VGVRRYKAGFSPNDHSHLPPARGPENRRRPSRRVGSLDAPARPVGLRFITNETETAAKIVSIGSPQKRPLSASRSRSRRSRRFARMLPLGSMGYENQINERGERLIWLAPNVINLLGAMRGPGESFSDVILRLAADQTRSV
jgi:hypothetical protein